MPSPARAPEQIIRDWLEQNGSTKVGLDAFEQTWSVDRLEPADRRRIAAALDAVGVDVDPPLQRASRSEKLTLSVRAAEPEPDLEPEPDPESDPESEPESEPEPDREPDPEPSTEPTSEAAEPPGRLRRRRRSLRGRGTPPPPVPSSTAREDALRADAARELARAERERERLRVAAEQAAQAEHAERERLEREREAAQLARLQEEARAEERAEEERERERATAEAEYRRERERARTEAAARQAEEEAAAPEPESEAPLVPVSRATVGVAVAGIVLMVLGSLGPWAKAVFVTDYGVDRSGVAVIAAAVVAAVVLFLHLRRGRDSWLPLVVAAAGAFAGALVAGDFIDLVNDSFVSPTWGLYMAFLGSVVVVGISMTLLVRRP